MRRTTVKLALFLGLFCFAVAPLQAVTFTFTNITNNNLADAAIGEAQLSVDVTDAGGGQVLFTFLNVGTDASSITDVYFDDGSLLGIAFIFDSAPDVIFSAAGAGPVLPGGDTVSPPFVVTAAFSIGAEGGMGGVPAHGVNPGETLGILFNLKAGKIFQDVLDDLASGALRIGIHVIAYDSGGSESFVNNGPVNGVPEPATFFLLGMGLLGMVGVAFANKRNLDS